MRSAEILSKRLNKSIFESCGIECKAKPSQGMLFSAKWQRIAWVKPVPGGAPPDIVWKFAAAKIAGIDVTRAQEAFLATLVRNVDRVDEGEWESL